MKNLTLIVMAAGNSTRFCNDNGAYEYITKVAKTYSNQDKELQNISVRKQWLRLGTTPLWLYVTNTLVLYILEILKDLQQHKISLEKIIITSSSEDINYINKLVSSSLGFYVDGDLLEIPLQIVMGGDSRFKSLKNAIQAVETNFIIVNDCARFNTSKSVLKHMLTLFSQDDYDCIVPYLEVTDTTLIFNDADSRHSVIDREKIKLIQTPQLTNVEKLMQTFDKNIDFSDESSAICTLDNAKLGFVAGNKDMIKLTYKNDLKLLRKLYNKNPYFRKNNLLIGHGSDIHGFVESKEMYLCGVKIESDFGFKAHSDGDVGIHAIIDSILGAMNYGDIGELFPDKDNTFKDIDSKILLKHVYDYCLSVGLEIMNLDLTVIAQTPRISQYKSQMQEVLANILYISKSQISIKASTAEKLGFIGRKEGVLAQSIVQLRARLF